MILNKPTRKRLFAGQPIELLLPPTANPPFRTGGSYPIETDKDKPPVGTFRVLRQKVKGAWAPKGWDGGWRVTIAHDVDQSLRLLGRTLDYTEIPNLALRGDRGAEPEAVDEEEQYELTKRAHMQAGERRDMQRLEREKRSLEARLGIAQKVAEVRGIDISPHTRVIRERLERIEKVVFEERRAEEAA